VNKTVIIMNGKERVISQYYDEDIFKDDFSLALITVYNKFRCNDGTPTAYFGYETIKLLLANSIDEDKLPEILERLKFVSYSIDDGDRFNARHTFIKNLSPMYHRDGKVLDFIRYKGMNCKLGNFKNGLVIALD